MAASTMSAVAFNEKFNGWKRSDLQLHGFHIVSLLGNKSTEACALITKLIAITKAV